MSHSMDRANSFNSDAPPTHSSCGLKPTAGDPADTQQQEGRLLAGGEDRPLVHKVGVPAKTTLRSEIEAVVREAFFSDDPLRQFRGTAGTKRWMVGLSYIFPILGWLPSYNRNLLKGDIIAGLTIASLAVPQDLGYAKLANLNPINGLYSSFVPPLVYATLGSSRDIAIGPVAVVSILLGQLLKDKIDPKEDPVNYLRLALTATFFAGVVQAGLGLLRLGFIIDFLSHAAIVGFMAGAAITIGLQQLKGMLGLTNFTKNTDFVSVMRSVWTNTHQWNWQTILLGIFFLILLLISKLVAKKKKKLFWIAAIAPLVSVILATLFVAVTRLDKHDVKIVGHITKGINPSSVHQIFWSGDRVSDGFKIGLVAGLVALTEAAAIGRTFAALKDYHIDGNKEFLSLGIMNIAGSLTSCYVATGSFSRSAVNYQAGVNTAMSNIVMALIVLFTLLVLTPLFHYTPNCILSAAIISAVVSLIDLKAAHQIWKTDKMDFVVLMGAFFGVFFVSVEIGLLIAVVISFAKILWHVTRPHTALLGNIPGTSIYRSVKQYPDSMTEPGIVIVRVDSAIYFSNSNYIRERIIRYVNDEQEKLADVGGEPIRFVIVELTPVGSVDTTAIHAFEELDVGLRKRDIRLCMSNPGGDVMEKLQACGFLERLGHEWVFLSVAEAVQVCTIIMKRKPHNIQEKNFETV